MKEKVILKGIFHEFDTVNRNGVIFTSPPSYRVRGFWPKNFLRLRKIKRILNDKAGEI
jgi:hypothetical protein